MNLAHAKDILVTKLVTLRPHADVFDAIHLLLRHRITGAPVIDEKGKLLGVFSDKSCMNVLAAALGKCGQEHQISGTLPRAKDVMVTRLMTTTPGMDAFEAVGRLLKKCVSGAPVIDDEGKFVGVFSERYAMKMLVGSVCDQLPTMNVSECMNTDFKRVISEDVDLPSIIQLFVDYYFRRLCVLRNETLVGQISRRDVLRVARKLLTDSRRDPVRDYENSHEEFRNTPAEEVFMVSTFMNKEPRTITEDTDFLSMAEIFLNTNNRRLPVLREGKLIGQISRRDLLQATYELTAVPLERESSLLYLSALVERRDAPIG
ncbi:MAG: CBS domain-containing protein [Planctomycetes bacterium]|nr:CBS domain-containing protein [Planctomycetota bacterium]